MKVRDFSLPAFAGKLMGRELFLALLCGLLFLGAPAGAMDTCPQSFARIGSSNLLSDGRLVLRGRKPFSLAEKSQANLSAYRKRLGHLIRVEAELAKKIESLPLTVSTRTRPELLEEISSYGGIIPLEQIRKKGMRVRSFIPRTEAELYGAQDWAFASVSASGFTGSPMYGSAVLGIDETFWRNHSWATPTSGLQVYEKQAGIPRGPLSMNGLAFGEEAGTRAAFDSQILAPRDYSAWIALDVVSYLRSQPAAVRAEFFNADQKKLQELMNRHKLGYLEAKLPELPKEALQGLEGTKLPWGAANGRVYTPEELRHHFGNQQENPQLDFYSLDTYRLREYGAINRSMFQGERADPMRQGLIDGIAESIEHSPAVPKDIVLYRVQTIEPGVNGANMELQEGATLEFKNFVSTSAQKAPTLQFARAERSVLFEIHMPKDASVKGLYMPAAFSGVAESEQEILLQRGTKVKIIRIEDLGKVPGTPDKNKQLLKAVVEIVP